MVPLVDHAGAINVDSGRPLVDLSGLHVALALHLSHGGSNVAFFGTSLMWVL